MPRINLLPWRSELRQQRKKEFLVAIMSAVVVGAVLVYGAKLTVEGWTSAQRGRNTILRNEIAELDKQIEEITGLENQRERLLARMQVIDQLQRSRPEVVHLFDELVDTLPEGVNLVEVIQQGTRIELRGEAQSSTRVSALMRNIDGSEHLKEPALDVVETVASGIDRTSQFKLFAQQVTIAGAEEEEAPAPAPAGQRRPRR